MYELGTQLTANTGGFLVPKKKRLRVGAGNDERRGQVYNANYMTDGTKYADFPKPWTAFTAIDFRTFKTHAEALKWVQEEARR